LDNNHLVEPQIDAIVVYLETRSVHDTKVNLTSPHLRGDLSGRRLDKGELDRRILEMKASQQIRQDLRTVCRVTPDSDLVQLARRDGFDIVLQSICCGNYVAGMPIER